MNTKDKNEELKFLIGRYDHYYDSINNKGNLYLTINTFILGGIIVGYTTLDNKYCFGTGVFILFIASLVANLSSSIYTLRAIKPYIKKNKGIDNRSNLFFGDVSNFTIPEWSERWHQMDDAIWSDTLKTQSHHLAYGLTKKFQWLNYATWFIGAQMICVIIFGIILLTL